MKLWLMQFKAHQPRLDRFVALKLLHGFLAQRGDHLERFQREAQSIAKLHHPNIVQVHDFDLLDNRMFMVMEFIDGRSLKEILLAVARFSSNAVACLQKVPLSWLPVRLVCKTAVSNKSR